LINKLFMPKKEDHSEEQKKEEEEEGQLPNWNSLLWELPWWQHKLIGWSSDLEVQSYYAHLPEFGKF
jgi:hypothetical protein